MKNKITIKELRNIIKKVINEELNLINELGPASRAKPRTLKELLFDLYRRFFESDNAEKLAKSFSKTKAGLNIPIETVLYECIMSTNFNQGDGEIDTEPIFRKPHFKYLHPKELYYRQSFRCPSPYNILKSKYGNKYDKILGKKINNLPAHYEYINSLTSLFLLEEEGFYLKLLVSMFEGEIMGIEFFLNSDNTLVKLLEKEEYDGYVNIEYIFPQTIIDEFIEKAGGYEQLKSDAMNAANDFFLSDYDDPNDEDHSRDFH